MPTKRTSTVKRGRNVVVVTDTPDMSSSGVEKRPVDEAVEDDEFSTDIRINTDAAVDTSDSEASEEEEKEEVEGIEFGESLGEEDSGWSGISDSSEESEVEEERELTPREKYTAPIDSEDDDFAPPVTSIGNVPLEWYDDFPHIGYDLNGKRVAKPATKDELDNLLDRMDDPKFMATFRDHDNHQDVTLTSEELDIIKKLQSGQVPHPEYDPYPEFDEPFVQQTMVMPLTAAPEPKSRFIRSKWEHARIMKVVKAIRQGLIMGKKPKAVESERYYDLWKGQDEEEQEPHPLHIPAPKIKLPDHSESYNPPEEYLLNEQERQEWLNTDAEDREFSYLPAKYDNLRSVPGYQPFINERFGRCLDLYLCPRTVRKRVLDPESLMPKLPDPKELEPFPKYHALTFTGHENRVRSFSIDPTGQWMVSGSDDMTVRVWEVASGKCMETWTFDHVIMSVDWNPSKALSLIAVASGKSLFIINPLIASKPIIEASDAIISAGDAAGSASIAPWIKEEVSARIDKGYRCTIKHTTEVNQVIWHKKGDYFASVATGGGNQAVLVHQLTKQASQNPFSKAKGLIQKVCFHPTKPLFLVASQTSVRIYNLIKQELHKKLMPGAKWISSIDVHPGGDNVIVGTYDKKSCWFDLDIGSQPYQMQRSHAYAVRNVAFHRRHPLFASCSDDGTVQVYHSMVYNDYLQNPLIVPVKKIQAHKRIEGLGALFCQFHPTQPWVLTSGSDGLIKMFC